MKSQKTQQTVRYYNESWLDSLPIPLWAILLMGILIAGVAFQSYQVYQLHQQLDRLHAEKSIPSELSVSTAHSSPDSIMRRETGNGGSLRYAVDSEQDETADEDGAIDPDSEDPLLAPASFGAPTMANTGSMTAHPATASSSNGGVLNGANPDAANLSANFSREEQVALLQKKIAQVIKNAQDLIKKGDFNGAMALLEQNLQENPTSPKLNQQLASLYRLLGMDQKEMDLYQNWSRQDPTSPTPHYELARLYESMGMDNQARAELQQYAQMTPNDPSALSRQASLYHKLGMSQAEGAALQSWLDAAPNDVSTHRALADYYRRTGNTQAALAEWQNVCDMTPNNVQAHRSLASAYMDSRQWGNAQAELNQAMNLRPNDMSVRMDLANAYRRGGDIQNALGTYYGIIQDDPSSAEAIRAQRVINQIEMAQQRQAAAAAAKKPKSLNVWRLAEVFD